MNTKKRVSLTNGADQTGCLHVDECGIFLNDQ